MVIVVVLSWTILVILVYCLRSYQPSHPIHLPPLWIMEKNKLDLINTIKVMSKVTWVTVLFFVNNLLLLGMY